MIWCSGISRYEIGRQGGTLYTHPHPERWRGASGTRTFPVPGVYSQLADAAEFVGV